MALALDGSVHRNVTSGTSTTVTLSTANSNDIIALVVEINGTTASSISSANTTGWASRAINASPRLELWYGIASNSLSSEIITVNFAGSTTYCTIDCFGISGADITNKWDSNGALPDIGTTGLRSITTSNADDFLIGAYRFSDTENPSGGTGWTEIFSTHFLLTEYKIVSSTQSGLSVTIGTGNGNQNGGLADAIMMATAGGGGLSIPVAMNQYRQRWA